MNFFKSLFDPDSDFNRNLLVWASDDPVRQKAIYDALDAAKDAKSEQASLFGGRDPKTKIDWAPGGRQAPTGINIDAETGQTIPGGGYTESVGAPKLGDAGSGPDLPPHLKDAPMMAVAKNGSMIPGAPMLNDQMQDYMKDRAGSVQRAFPEEFAAAARKKLFPAPPVLKDLAPGASVASVNPETGEGRIVMTAPDKADSFKVGATREVQRGDKKVTQEYDGAAWKDIGEGPAFAPHDEPAPVEVDDPTSPTGRRLVPRTQALNQPGPSQQSPQASANTLRDEFNKATEATRTVAAQARNAVKGAASNSAAGDMGLIYSFMKALDPGSSVKEGEYAQGEKLTGAYGQIWQSYNKAKDGTKLLPEVRRDILNQMKNIYTSHVPSYEAAKSRYGDIATRQRLNPADVVSDMSPVDWGDTPPAGAPPDAKRGKDPQGNDGWYTPDPLHPGNFIKW